jgi:outer membrane protein OmpA-like peptidoglycan-associated protein
MPIRTSTRPGALVGALLLAACAQVPVTERVVLLPGKDGRSGALVVGTSQGEIELSRPYDSVEIRDGRVTQRSAGAEEVQERFRGLLEARPAAPRSFLLHFRLGNAEFTPESASLLQEIQADLAARPAAEILVIGHADRLGPQQFNRPLSYLRAERVRELLVAAGVPPTIISIAGRGEDEPLVPTPNGHPEPRNRRAEIRVR